MIQKIAYFLHLIDDDNRLNLEDIAFCVIMVKIVMSPNVDWTALVSLAVCTLNMMHKYKVDATIDTSVVQNAIKEQTSSIQGFTEKISPVVDAVKGYLK